MINSSVTGVSGFNANAYTMAVARGKKETEQVSVPKSGPQLEQYWTPDRMRNAIPYPMPETEAETKPEPLIPEKKALPEAANPGSVSAGEPQQQQYWTPDRMRNAIPYPMPETEAETKPEPIIPGKNALPEDVNPSSVSAGEPQSQEYWTPDRMRNAIPYPMPETEAETKPEPLIPGKNALPEDVNPSSVSAGEPQSQEYWTPDRMRNAIPYPMPETEAETKPEPIIPGKNALPEDVNPSSVSAGEPQLQEYWTPDRMRNAIPYPMPETEAETKPEPLIPENSTLPEGTNPGSVVAGEPQLEQYWTPDRMRNAIPYPMPETEAETKPEPLIPGKNALPENTNSALTPKSASQPEEYWALERMREVASVSYNQPSESGSSFITKV